MKKIFKNSEKKFGIYISNFLKYNIYSVLVLVVLGLIAGLYPILYSNTLKHLIWGSFGYSLSLLLAIVILYEIINTISYKIKDNTIILSSIFLALMFSTFISFYYEGNLKNQESEICYNLIGCCALFLANLFFI